MSRLTILSYGGGQDSTTLLYQYVNNADFRKKYAPNKFMVVMSDTGNEHQETEWYVEYIKGYCKDHDVPFFHIGSYSDFFLDGWKGGLVAFMEKNSRVPSKAFPKSCTDQLKIRPIYKFLDEFIFKRSPTIRHIVTSEIKDLEKRKVLESITSKDPFAKPHAFPITQKRTIKAYVKMYGKINVLLGIAKGEESRVAKGHNGPVWFQQSINRVYPLIDLGLDRKGCQEYIESIGELVPFPSNCIICPFLSKQELLYMYRFNRQWYDRFVRMEQRKIDRSRAEGQPDEKNLGVWGKKLLPEILIEAMELHGEMTDDELKDYKMSHGHCTMSSY